MVKAGAFDTIDSNRYKLFSSIPKMIQKSKNNHENKLANQNSLFAEDSDKTEIFNNVDDWDFDERLSKEFESLGFFISDHPLNQYLSLLEMYEIITFDDFLHDESIKESNISGTILKIQEKNSKRQFLCNSKI